MLLTFIIFPLVQKELDVFRETVWNTHRIRAQKDTVLPDGIPDHIYNFPEQYNLKDCVKRYTPCLCKKKKKKKKKVSGQPLKGSGGEMDRKRGACNAPR